MLLHLVRHPDMKGQRGKPRPVHAFQGPALEALRVLLHWQGCCGMADEPAQDYQPGRGCHGGERHAEGGPAAPCQLQASLPEQGLPVQVLHPARSMHPDAVPSMAYAGSVYAYAQAYNPPWPKASHPCDESCEGLMASATMLSVCQAECIPHSLTTHCRACRFLDVGEASDTDDTSSTHTPTPEMPEASTGNFER